MVKEIVNNYIVYMKQINGDENVDTGKINMTKEEMKLALQDEGVTAIKNLLDKQYMETSSISDEIIKKNQYLYKQSGEYDKNVIYNLNYNDLVNVDLTNNISIILIDATLNDKDLKMIVKLDKLNNTYSIFLEDYIEKNNYNKSMNIDEININTDNIEVNNYNNNIKIDISETYLITQYFSEYRMKMINDTKKAYELLDEKYRKEKYGNYENFEKYIKKNENNIKYASIKKYQINEYEGIKEYVCVDNNGKYYIFTENSITDYDVILDTYTINLPSFLAKYNNNDGTIKSGLNVQKIFDAINDEDYNYVYGKLDETFKKNNFKSKNDFEKYVKKNFSNNQLEYENCEKNGELYICDITVTEGTENNDIAVRKNFIVKLLENTDFVFSFNIK